MSPWSGKSFWVMDFHVTKCVVTVLQFRCTHGGFHQVNHRFFSYCMNAFHPPLRDTTKPHIHNFFLRFSPTVPVSSLADDIVLRNRTQRSAKEWATIFFQTVMEYLTYICHFQTNSRCSHWTLLLTQRAFWIELSCDFTSPLHHKHARSNILHL